MLKLTLNPQTVTLSQQVLPAFELENVTFLALVTALQDPALSPELRVCFLRDLLNSLEQHYKRDIVSKDKIPRAKMSLKGKLLLGIVLAAGVLNTLCDSFGSMAVLLSTFTDIATVGIALIWGSLAFALLCAIMFVLYQLCQQARAREANSFGVSEILSYQLEERALLNDLMVFMDTGMFLRSLQREEVCPETLAACKEMLCTRVEFLKTVGKGLADKRASRVVSIGRQLMLGALTVWVVTVGFMSGFFALSMIPVLLPMVVIPLWACIMLGVVAGVLTLAAFLAGGREETSLAIDRFMSLDQAWIDTLQQETRVNLEAIRPLTPVSVPQAAVFALHPVASLDTSGARRETGAIIDIDPNSLRM